MRPSPPSVRWHRPASAVYHDLFFDVRPRLGSTGYIQNVVLGGKIHRGLSLEDRELVLKNMAFLRGPRAVDGILEFYHAPPPELPSSLKNLDTAELRRLRSRLVMKDALLGFTLPNGIAREMTQRFADFRPRSLS